MHFGFLDDIFLSNVGEQELVSLGILIVTIFLKHFKYLTYFSGSRFFINDHMAYFGLLILFKKFTWFNTDFWEWHPSNNKSSLAYNNFRNFPFLINCRRPKSLIFFNAFRIILFLIFKSLATFIANAIFSHSPSLWISLALSFKIPFLS